MPPSSTPPPTTLRPKAKGSRLDRLKGFFKTKTGIVTAAVLFILAGSGAAYLTAPDDLGTTLNTGNSQPAKDDPSLIDEEVTEGEAATEEEEAAAPTPASTPPPPPPPPPPPAAPVTKSVTIDSTGFFPQALAIKKGTTVVWTNNDTIAHTVTSDSPVGPNSPQIATKDNAPDNTYSYTFNVTGTISYQCALHSGTTGTIVVTD